MKPVVWANFSLPPALRFKTEYMFMHMILPSKAKAHGLKKYFDFAAAFELDSLYHTGILLLLLLLLLLCIFVFLYFLYSTTSNRNVGHQGQAFQHVDGHPRKTRTTGYFLDRLLTM